MSDRGRACPECQSELKLVMLSDLVGDLKAAGPKMTLPAASAVFDYFDFWVCPRCGRTLLYADDRARARAAGREVRRDGSTLGLA